MAGEGRKTGSDVTALQESPETINDATKTMPERSAGNVFVEAGAAVGPTESEIAKVAYQLWLDDGCPVGSDQEYWFRAEAMLKNAQGVKREDLFRSPSIPRLSPRTKSDVLAEFRWMGHWEVWEREWGGARWISDLGRSRR